MSGLTRKEITLTFQLGQGQFGTSGFSNLKLEGLRVQCDIATAGALYKGLLNLRIYGMTLSQMNALARIGLVDPLTRQNLVSVEAGDSVSGLRQIYQGAIRMAWADLNAMPDVAFIVEAVSGYWQAMAPMKANSWKGTIDVANIIANLATQMGLNFQNFGVSFILNNPVLPGSGWDQLSAAVSAANINCTIDQNTVVIWPRNGSRGALPGVASAPGIPTVSTATGMIGYPKFNATGITVETIFNPDIIAGSQINVISAIRPTADVWGPWQVNTIAHNLESRRPGGNWKSTLECSLVGQTVLQGGAR